jgi:hypothetical protein
MSGKVWKKPKRPLEACNDTIFHTIKPGVYSNICAKEKQNRSEDMLDFSNGGHSLGQYGRKKRPEYKPLSDDHGLGPYGRKNASCNDTKR